MNDIYTGRSPKEKILNQKSYAAHMTLSSLVILCLCFILWAALTKVDEIARTDQGRISPSLKTQYIQSLDGGILKKLHVQEGQMVKKGTLLAEIDPTQFQSKMDQHTIKIQSLKIKALRLLSEATSKHFVIPQNLKEQAPTIAASEEKLYQSRTTEHALKLKILRDEKKGLEQQIEETDSAIRSYQRTLSLKEQEYSMLKNLKSSGSVSTKELLDIQSSISDLHSQIEQGFSKQEQKQTQIDSLLKKIEESKITFKKDAYREYTQMKSELSSLLKENISVSDKVDRTSLYSPVDGIIHQVLTHTQGGVLKPGDTLCEIIPIDEKLIVEAKILPKDIGFIHPGMKASVKVTTYDYSLFGGLDGTVLQISPDVIIEKDQAFYLVKIETDKSYLERMGVQYPIIPGMNAQVDILTGHKSVLAYILKPIFKAKQKALTER